MKSTNYYNSFIAVADDCPISEAEIPRVKSDKKSVPLLQYEMISKNPYKYDSDEVLFQLLRKNISSNDASEKEAFFSKGQACFRASSLGKRYGWGVHFNKDGKMALVPLGSDEYENFRNDKNLQQLKAMRNKLAQ